MNVKVDNNYIYKYLDEQAERNSERTRAMHILNKKKEIPFLIAKYGIIGFLILSIGLALNYANSFTQKILHQTVAEKGNISQQYHVNNEDELIDLESLLAGLNEEIIDFPTEPLTDELPPDVVRNYVIFDEIPFDHNEIRKVTVGRQYDSPDSKFTSAWCYIERDGVNGIVDTLYLKQVDENGSDKLDITDLVASEFQVTIDIIKKAQSICTI